MDHSMGKKLAGFAWIQAQARGNALGFSCILTTTVAVLNLCPATRSGFL
jgi:hypothetical protein